MTSCLLIRHRSNWQFKTSIHKEKTTKCSLSMIYSHQKHLRRTFFKSPAAISLEKYCRDIMGPSSHMAKLAQERHIRWWVMFAPNKKRESSQDVFNQSSKQQNLTVPKTFSLCAPISSYTTRNYAICCTSTKKENSSWDNHLKKASLLKT